MSSKFINILKYLFFAILAFVLCWFPIKDLTPEQRGEILRSFQDVHLWVLIPVFIAGLLSHISRAIRWKMLIETTGKSPNIYNTFYAIIIGYNANLAFPRLGEVLRCGILNRYEKIELDKLIGTMLIERLVDVLFLLLVILITALSQSTLFFEYLESQGAGAKLSDKLLHSMPLLAGMLIVGVIGIFVIRYILHKTSYGAALKEKLIGVKNGILSIQKVPNKWAFWGHSAFIWLMYLSMMYIAFQAMDITKHLGMSATLSLLTFGSIAMLITPGGIGAYPLAIASILVAYNIPFQPQGLAFGWIIWVAQTLIILILGVISIALLMIRNRNQPLI